MAAIISGGIATLKIDGTQYMVRGSAKIKPASVKNAAIANQDGSVVFTKTPVFPMITLNLSDYGQLSILSITQIAGSTIQLALTNGKSFTMTNGTYIDETELNTEDGSFGVSFAGSLVNEMVAG